MHLGQGTKCCLAGQLCCLVGRRGGERADKLGRSARLQCCGVGLWKKLLVPELRWLVRRMRVVSGAIRAPAAPARSGYEGAWTANPTKLDNSYFQAPSAATQCPQQSCFRTQHALAILCRYCGIAFERLLDRPDLMIMSCSVCLDASNRVVAHRWAFFPRSARSLWARLHPNMSPLV